MLPIDCRMVDSRKSEKKEITYELNLTVKEIAIHIKYGMRGADLYV